jgi:hypothetical protein
MVRLFCLIVSFVLWATLSMSPAAAQNTYDFKDSRCYDGVASQADRPGTYRCRATCRAPARVLDNGACFIGNELAYPLYVWCSRDDPSPTLSPTSLWPVTVGSPTVNQWVSSVCLNRTPPQPSSRAVPTPVRPRTPSAEPEPPRSEANSGKAVPLNQAPSSSLARAMQQPMSKLSASEPPANYAPEIMGQAAIDRDGRRCVSVAKNTHSLIRGLNGYFVQYDLVLHNNCDSKVVVGFKENAGEDPGTWGIGPGVDFKQFCTDGYKGQHDCHGYKGYWATFEKQH